MLLKIDGKEIPQYPIEFVVTPMDLDDGETTARTADGTLHRDRVAVKRSIDLAWGLLTWNDTSTILKLLSPVFFELTYPDPMTGTYETKTFYTGNRPTPSALSKGDELYWNGLKVTLIER